MLELLGYIAIIILTAPFSLGLIIGSMNYIGYYTVIGGGRNKPIVRVSAVLTIILVTCYWIWFLSLSPVKLIFIESN